MHPWHDIYVDDHLIAKVFPVVIEVPMGSKNKYELDKEAGLMRLDRVLYSAVYYPAKILEHKEVVVEDFMGPDEAVKILQEALDLYRQLRRGEVRPKQVQETGTGILRTGVKLEP